MLDNDNPSDPAGNIVPHHHISPPDIVLLAWKRCALDLVCSANTIRSYINRFGKVIVIARDYACVSHANAQDCNGDQLVTCEDYVMIHKNGGWNCGNSLQGSKFWNIFQECKDMVIARGLNI